MLLLQEESSFKTTLQSNTSPISKKTKQTCISTCSSTFNSIGYVFYGVSRKLVDMAKDYQGITENVKQGSPTSELWTTRNWATQVTEAPSAYVQDAGSTRNLSQPPYGSWKNCSRQNQLLTPQRLGAAGVKSVADDLQEIYRFQYLGKEGGNIL